MYIFPFFIVVLWTCQIKGDNIKFVNIDLNTKNSTNYLQVKKIQSGDIIKYNITTKSGCRCQKVKDNEHMIYKPYESEVFKGVNVLYFKGVDEPTIVEIIYENNYTYNVTNYNYYIRYHRVGWKRSLRDFYKVDFKILLTNIYEGNCLKCPKFLDLDLNNRTSNEAVDVKCSNVGDTWTFRFFPRQGYVILLVTAKGGIIWQLTGSYLMPSEVRLSISDDTLVSLIFKDPKRKCAPATITYRIHPGKTKYTVSGRDDADITKKATLISSTDVDEEEKDEQGVIEDTTAWTQGIEVSEEEMKQLAELQEQKTLEERVDKEVIELEADLGEEEGEVIEEGTTPSGEDIEPDIEEVEESIEEVQEEEEDIVPEVEIDEVEEIEDEEMKVREMAEAERRAKIELLEAEMAGFSLIDEAPLTITETLHKRLYEDDDLIVPEVEDIEIDVLLLDQSCHVKRTYGETTHTIAFITPHRAVKVKYGDLVLWESENMDEHCKIIDIFSKNGNDLMVLSILNDKTSSILPGFYHCSRDFECNKFNYENFVYMWNEFKFTFDTIGGIIDYSDYSRVMEIVGEPLDDELPYGRCGIDDHFKDLKPITLDIYNHETEGLEVKVKQYSNYSSTINTCRPKDGYILDSVYDSQRNEMLWKRYKNNKYAVVALVNANDLELIVIFVIDVNPQKSEVIYYKYSLLYGWEECFRESLTKCYLDTVIKGEWRISEKIFVICYTK